MAIAAPITSITFDRNSSEDITPQIPEYLYAYTDPNASGETLYGWGESTGEYGMYTKSLTPVAGDDVFNRKGVKYTASSVESVASDYSYIITGPAGPQLRNSSLDVVIYDNPPTLYTDSTTLTTGMTLYDNTGTDTGHKVGEISGDSFDIQVTNRSKLLLQNGNQSEVFNPQESQIILSSLFAWLDDRGIEHDSIEDISGFYGQFPSIVVANVIFNELSADLTMSNCIDHVNIAFLTNFDLSNYDMIPISFFINDVNAVDLSFYSEEFAINARNSLFNSEEDIHLEDIGGLFVDNITFDYGFNLSGFETSAFDTTGTLIASDLGILPDGFRYLFSSWFDDEASQITTIDNFIIKIPFMQGVNPE